MNVIEIKPNRALDYLLIILVILNAATTENASRR